MTLTLLQVWHCANYAFGLKQGFFFVFLPYTKSVLLENSVCTLLDGAKHNIR